MPSEAVPLTICRLTCNSAVFYMGFTFAIIVCHLRQDFIACAKKIIYGNLAELNIILIDTWLGVSLGEIKNLSA